MGAFTNWNYHNWHELNLDFLIEEVKKLAEEWATYHADWESWKNNTDTAFQNLLDYVTDYFDNLDVTEEVKDNINQMASDGRLAEIIQPLFDAYKTEINGIVSEQFNEISVLSSRMDTFTHLTEGSTTGDAELQDIRISYDGVTYSTAGDSVRTQVRNVNNKVYSLGEIYPALMAGYWNADGVMSSPASPYNEVSTDFIYVNEGDTVEIDLHFNKTVSNFWGCALFKYTNDTYTRETYTGNIDRLKKEFVIPSDVIAIAFSFRTFETEYSVSFNYWQEVNKAIKNSELFENIVNINYVLGDGYYNADGSIHKPSVNEREKYTNKVRIIGGSKIYVELSFDAILPSPPVYEMSWGAISQFKKDGTATRTEIPIDSNVPTRTNKRTALFTLDSDTVYVAFSFRTYNYNYNFKAFYLPNNVAITDKISEVFNEKINPFINTPFYSHTLIDKIDGNNVIIPSESIFNVEMDSRLGYTMVEGNAHTTSDGNFVVMHGVNGTFGNQVEHVDGVTDISTIRFNSVTLAWIKENVRYKSIYPKYRIAPPSLNEWLTEVKRNGMIPVITCTSSDMHKQIVDIMGDNFIAYGGTRELTDGMIMNYATNLDTKETILEFCERYKPPFMMCLGNTSSFTDEELIEISELLHANGYLVGIASCYSGESEWQRVYKCGFDFTASGWNVPKIENANLYNLVGESDYSKFSTNGTIANGTISLTTSQTVTPVLDSYTPSLSASQLQINFIGSVNITMGDYINEVYNSNGENSLIFSTYYMESIPSFTITATDNTVINSIIYRVTEC